jgi:hypothetical protein
MTTALRPHDTAIRIAMPARARQGGVASGLRIAP